MDEEGKGRESAETTDPNKADFLREIIRGEVFLKQFRIRLEEQETVKTATQLILNERFLPIHLS